MPKTIKSTDPTKHSGNAAYPVRLDSEDRANLEVLYGRLDGVSRTTLLKALVRMAMARALERPELLAQHILRPGK